MSFKDWRFFLTKKKQKKAEKNPYESLEKVFTPVNFLAVGMYVTELDRPWLESPFPFQGFELKTEETVQAVKDVCEFVYIDLSRTKKVVSPVIKRVHAPIVYQNILDYGAPPRKLSVFEKEIVNTEKVYESTSAIVSDFMEKIVKGGGIDTTLAKLAVSECVNSVLQSPDAALWLTQLKHKDEYTAQHSLNVCVLSIVLGRHLNLPEPQLNVVGLCGMMHDMGKMLVPLHILNKPGKLEEEELEIMQSHTTLGYELLRSSDGMHVNAIDVAYSHHERLDGTGYPRRIKPVHLSECARIVAIADMYDAITSDRVYQKGRTHLEATHIMSNMAGAHLDKMLLIKFIESIGIYPPGCLVQMTNGAVAIVVEVNEKMKLRPKIIIILDEEKNPVPEAVIDLSTMITDQRGDIYTIRSIVRAEDWNIDSAKYYQGGVLQKGFAMGNALDK
jgi:HD-GYP domain-containing protein (c-di-GMP phosphodiesterase class II)